MEKYSIRHDKEKFVQTLYNIKEKVSKADFDKFDMSIALSVVELRHLWSLCREQSLTTIGKISPCRELVKYSNYLDTAVSCAVIDKDRENFLSTKSLFMSGFTDFVEEIEKSLNVLVLKIKDRIENEDYNGATDDVQRVEQTLKLIDEKLLKEANYLDQVKPKETNKPLVVVGSVAIHQFFTNLKLPHTIVRFGGIKYSNSNKSEINTPITLLHDQKLIMVKLKPYKFHFKKEPLTLTEIDERKQAIAYEIKQANFKDTDVDMSVYVSGGFLMSKRFKGYAFIWFMDRELFKQLPHIPESKSYLMWPE